jgi:hypothetical protein
MIAIFGIPGCNQFAHHHCATRTEGETWLDTHALKLGESVEALVNRRHSEVVSNRKAKSYRLFDCLDSIANDFEPCEEMMVRAVVLYSEDESGLLKVRTRRLAEVLDYEPVGKVTPLLGWPTDAMRQVRIGDVEIPGLRIGTTAAGKIETKTFLVEVR